MPHRQAETFGESSEPPALFERLLAIRNDVGLLSEEYDPAGKCLLGNFPQAFSHVGLVNTAFHSGRSTLQPALSESAPVTLR